MDVYETQTAGVGEYFSLQESLAIIGSRWNLERVLEVLRVLSPTTHVATHLGGPDGGPWPGSGMDTSAAAASTKSCELPDWPRPRGGPSSESTDIPSWPEEGWRGMPWSPPSWPCLSGRKVVVWGVIGGQGNRRIMQTRIGIDHNQHH